MKNAGCFNVEPTNFYSVTYSHPQYRSVEKLKVSTNDEESTSAKEESSSTKACRKLFVSTDHSYTPKDLQNVSEKVSDILDDKLHAKITNPVNGRYVIFD